MMTDESPLISSGQTFLPIKIHCGTRSGGVCLLCAALRVRTNSFQILLHLATESFHVLDSFHVYSSSKGLTSWSLFVCIFWDAGVHGFPSGVYTLTCCTHIFLEYTHCAYTSHILMLVTHMHGSRCAARMSSSLCHLILSLLTFHPSLLLLFFDGQFETFPDLDDLTDISVHAILPNFSDLKVQVKRTVHEDEQFGHLAKSVPNTGSIACVSVVSALKPDGKPMVRNWRTNSIFL